MKKKIAFILVVAVAVILLLGALVATKLSQFAAMAAAGANGGPPPSTVSAAQVEWAEWEQRLQAVGSVEPIRGILIEAEMPGRIVEIGFENGQYVEAGDLLVQMDITAESAQLRAAIATARLNELEFERAQRLREGGSIPQSQLDTVIADLERARAEIDNIQAIIERKTIQAPFSGQVGLRLVNPGQYVPQGASIVTLQSNDQVYINFSLPQRTLSQLETDAPVELRSDAFPGQVFEGQLTAISPEINPRTRSIEVQATVDNPDGALRSGLFVEVEIILPNTEAVAIVPATAVLYAPYGNSIYRVVETVDPDTGVASFTAKQTFIRTGRTRGDFVAITDGLEIGDRIVTSGAFKLRNDSPIIINNELAPKPELDPTPDNT